MILFAVVGCFFGIQVQCGAVYDRENVYSSVESCKMRQEELFGDTEIDQNMDVKAYCIDWYGPKEKLIPFLKMNFGYHKKEDA